MSIPKHFAVAVHRQTDPLMWSLRVIDAADTANGAHRALTGHLAKSAAQVRIDPLGQYIPLDVVTVLYTPGAVIDAVNAALAQDPHAMLTDPLVHTIAKALDRLRTPPWERPPAPSGGRHRAARAVDAPSYAQVPA